MRYINLHFTYLLTYRQTDRQTDGTAIASTALAMRALRRAAKTTTNDARLAPTTKPEVEIWRKLHKRTVPLSVGELGHRLTQCHLGRGLSSYQVASCSIQQSGYNTPTLQTRPIN